MMGGLSQRKPTGQATKGTNQLGGPCQIDKSGQPRGMILSARVTNTPTIACKEKFGPLCASIFPCTEATMD